MPFPNEHAARLLPPGQFDEFRRNNNRLGSGVHAIFGIRKGPPRVSELQAIRFGFKKFTVAEARKWLRDHDFKPILFEPATGEGGKAVDLLEKTMEKMWIKLTSDWGDHKTDEKVEVDEETALKLIDVEVAVKIEKDSVTSAIAEDLEKKIENGFTKYGEKLISTIDSSLAKAGNAVASRIHVGMTGDEKLLQTGGFKGFSHFAHDVFKAGRSASEASETLQKYISIKVPQGQSELIDSDGGLLLPVELSTRLMEQTLEGSIIEPRAETIPMQSSTIRINAVVDEDHSGGRFGGVKVFRAKEAGQFTKDTIPFRQIELNLHKLTGLAHATDEVLSDSPISLDAVINRRFAEAMRFKKDSEFFNENGVGAPQGVLNANATVVQAKKSGQAADTIVFDNIVQMFSRMWTGGMTNAVWVANHDTFPQLAQMQMGAGDGLAFVPPGRATDSPFGTILGRPVILSEHVPTLGDEADIGLYDFSQYWIGVRAGEGLKTATSIHLRFDFEETAFRFSLRNDGQSSWRVALTPEKSALTLSPFVVLAART